MRKSGSAQTRGTAKSAAGNYCKFYTR